MADAVTVANLPPGLSLYAGYINGRYENAGAILTAHPQAKVVTIDVLGDHPTADILDIETGDASPTSAPSWIQRGGKGLYCNSSTWPEVERALANAGMGLPPSGYWIAQFDNDPTIPQSWVLRGCFAKQYAGGMTAAYDISSVQDSWPGIDTEEDMPLNDADKQWISENTTQHLTDFYNNQYAPRLAEIQADLDQIKTKLQA